MKKRKFEMKKSVSKMATAEIYGPAQLHSKLDSSSFADYGRITSTSCEEKGIDWSFWCFVTIANQEFGKQSTIFNDGNENDQRYIDNCGRKVACLFVRCVMTAKFTVL